MYYPELSDLISKIGSKETIEKLDKYFAFLPNKSSSVITASNIASKLELDYSIIEILLKKIYELGIIDKVYIVECPECGRIILTCNKKELLERIENLDFCIKCKNDIKITAEDIFVEYRLVKSPNIDSSDIAKETEKLLGGIKEDVDDSAMLRKLFEKNKENPHDFFYNPSIETKQRISDLYISLDAEHTTTKAKGDSLEGLVKELFNIPYGMKTTETIKTGTNQIDCTVRNDFAIPLTVYNELGSIFKIECKNEPNKKPNNTYYQKLYSIINRSKNPCEQSVGIIISRLPPTDPCNQLAREFFLRDNVIIINICNEDLNKLIYNNTNLLDLIQEKIQYVKNDISTTPEKHKLYQK